jgi:hypothetical protein
MQRIVVVFPAPFGPSEPDHATRAHGQAAPVESHAIAVALVQAHDLQPLAGDRRTSPGIVRRAVLRDGRELVHRVSGWPMGDQRRYARCHVAETTVHRRERAGELPMPVQDSARMPLAPPGATLGLIPAATGRCAVARA